MLILKIIIKVQIFLLLFFLVAFSTNLGFFSQAHFWNYGLIKIKRS